MRKRKQHNPLKQLQSIAKATLKNSAIGFVTGGTKHCQLIDLKQNKLVPVTSNKFDLISKLRHPWSVLIAAFGIDANGQYYMKSKEISVTHPTFQVDMVDTLNEYHNQLRSEFNPAHLISLGWIATPFLKEWQEAEAFSLLETLGALDFEKVDGDIYHK